jgi:hypothetical protein
MDKTIDMAREAGWKDLRDYDSEMRHDFFMGNTDSLKAFEALVRADEREACAKLCDELDQKLWEDMGESMSGYGEAIREKT